MSETKKTDGATLFGNFPDKLGRYLSKPIGLDHPYVAWKEWEKVLFRFFFLFLLYFILPLDWKFYRTLFSIDWTDLHFYHLLTLSKYQPEFFPLKDSENVPVLGIAAYSNWGLGALGAAIGAFVWGSIDKEKRAYTVLYYWLRVIVRYRLAIALLGYGFYKLFVLQIPYPSLSNLFTNYGDFYAWKIYFQTTGISSIYESFLGFVEIFAAVLILNRKTVTLGAGIIIGFLGNVAVVNGFYDVGELSFSTLSVLFAAFLFAHDVPRLYKLLVKEKYTVANRLIPDYSDGQLKKIRYGVKTFVFLIALSFAYTAYGSWTEGSYKLPRTPGLPDAFGFYHVKEFILNKDTIPYSKVDPDRWQDVVFEKWSTLSINVNRPVKIDRTSGDELYENDIDRNYELAGFAGRHYYHYEIDTIGQKLLLQNKNKHHRDEQFSLSYFRPNDAVILLEGINDHQDSIKVVLEKVEKPYMLYIGRRKAARL